MLPARAGLAPAGRGEDDLARKVAALSSPACYPAPPAEVQRIETHMSWVFLTPGHAWKLKKPVRYDGLDFRSLQARRFFCEEELRLNRRLAPQVYLDVVPLVRAADGRLRLGQPGEAVDWLVKMRRLGAACLLDALLARRMATADHLRAVAVRLAAFYREAAPAPIDAPGYLALLRRHLDAQGRALRDPAWQLPAARVQAIGQRQHAFLHRHAQVLAARVASGRVVDGHGDLRPEHVWLGEPLAIIDALEFSPELRLQDSADEVGFLALECERARAPQLGAVLMDTYRAAAGDDIAPELVHFYQSCRACARAGLAIAHLREARYRGSPQWRMRCLRYLALAERHLRLAELTAAAIP